MTDNPRCQRLATSRSVFRTPSVKPRPMRCGTIAPRGVSAPTSSQNGSTSSTQRRPPARSKPSSMTCPLSRPISPRHGAAARSTSQCRPLHSPLCPPSWLCLLPRMFICCGSRGRCSRWLGAVGDSGADSSHDDGCGAGGPLLSSVTTTRSSSRAPSPLAGARPGLGASRPGKPPPAQGFMYTGADRGSSTSRDAPGYEKRAHIDRVDVRWGISQPVLHRDPARLRGLGGDVSVPRVLRRGQAREG